MTDEMHYEYLLKIKLIVFKCWYALKLVKLLKYKNWNVTGTKNT